MKYILIHPILIQPFFNIYFDMLFRRRLEDSFTVKRMVTLEFLEFQSDHDIINIIYYDSFKLE